MSRKILQFAAGFSVLVSSFAAMPAHASLKGALQKGQTQYIEAKLQPGRYILYMVSTDAVSKAPSEASLTIYEPTGKLLKKSSQLPQALQIRPKSGAVYDKGAVIEISRPQTLHFWVQMNICKAMCGFSVIPVRVTSERIDVVDVPAQVLPKRPSYNSPASGTSSPSGQGSKPTNQTSGSNPPTNQTSASNARKYIVKTNSHIDTGISVNPGDRITIRASGRIRFGFIAGSGGPKGIAFNPEYNYFFNMLHGQLMGRIRRFGMPELDGWFPVGEGGELVAKTQGVLEFAVNDNQPGDNSGSFQIEVTIDSPR